MGTDVHTSAARGSAHTSRLFTLDSIPTMQEDAAALIAELVFSGSRGSRRVPHPDASGLL